MMKKWIILIALVSVAVLAGQSRAGYSVGYDPGTQYNISGALTGFVTTGADMVGMEVTAYTGTSSETAVWTGTGDDSGGAAGTGWFFALSVDGDTFISRWNLTTTVGIDRLVINGLPGNTVFDAISDPELTPGSARGKPFSEVTGDANHTVVATYRNQVALNNVWYGDLYGMLDITWDSLYIGTMTWLADTDNATPDSVITPVVPEPGSMLVWSAIFGLGLAGASWRRRRRAD